jgi:tetratricopeptide (TPR) repeat protein
MRVGLTQTMTRILRAALAPRVLLLCALGVSAASALTPPNVLAQEEPTGPRRGPGMKGAGPRGAGPNGGRLGGGPRAGQGAPKLADGPKAPNADLELDDPSELELPTAPANGLFTVMRTMRQGFNRMAMAEARGLLDELPDDEDLHVLLGIVLAREGHYGDALPEFVFGLGSSQYERDGIYEHANALRFLGRGHEAAALRLSRLVTESGEDDDLRIYTEAARDLRYAGDMDGAKALLDDVMALYPGAVLPLALYGDILLDEGDLDGAYFHLFLANRITKNSPQVQILRVRLMLAEDDTEGAVMLLNKLRRSYQRNEEIVGLRAEAFLQAGDPDAALAYLNLKRWARRGDPQLLSRRLRALHGVGEHAEAKLLMDHLLWVYPHDREVQRAVAEVRGGR